MGETFHALPGAFSDLHSCQYTRGMGDVLCMCVYTLMLLLNQCLALSSSEAKHTALKLVIPYEEHSKPFSSVWLVDVKLLYLDEFHNHLLPLHYLQISELILVAI